MTTQDDQPPKTEQVRQNVTNYVQELPAQDRQTLGGLAEKQIALSTASSMQTEQVTEGPSLEMLIGTINGILDEANGRIGGIKYAPAIKGMLETAKLANRDWAFGLLRVSVGLHLSGGEIFDLRKGHSADDIIAAFRYVAGSGAERPYIEGVGADTLKANDRASFIEWGRMFWDKVAKLTSLTPAVAAEVFDHDKGYNRSIGYAGEALEKEKPAEERGDLLAKALAGPVDKVGRVAWERNSLGQKAMTGFYAAGLIEPGVTTYTEVAGLLQTHAVLIETMLGSAVDLASAKNAMEDFGVTGIPD